MSDTSKMSFLEHLEELRRRLIICLVAILVGMIVCWFLREQILAFLISPLYKAWSQVQGLPAPKPLNFSSMIEPFIAYMKLAAIGGIFFAAPVVLYQLWKFVAPGLYPKERRLAAPFVIVSSLLFVGGSLLAYAVVLPIGFKFFLEFASGRQSSPVETVAVVPASYGKGETAASEPPAGNKEEKGEKGFEEWLGSLFSKKSCASFSASLKPEAKSVVLTLLWSSAACGDLPTLNGFKRNGAHIDAKWEGNNDKNQQFLMVTAEDNHPAPGENRYELTVPSEPSASNLIPILMIKDYLSFAMQLLLAFGLIFELPVLISFLSFAGIVDYKKLIRFSRWFIVIAVIIGAILTPPDVLSQILLAVPLIVLYFLSILVAYFFGAKKES